MATTAHLLAALWERNRPQVMGRVALLESAARATAAGQLTEPERLAALDVAHKLAGSLGMYGFPAGTDAARTLEQELERAQPDPDTLQTFCAALSSALA